MTTTTTTTSPVDDHRWQELSLTIAEGDYFPRAVIRFVRLLRRSGLSIGSSEIVSALRALEIVGVGDRQQLYWTLFATLVHNPDQREIFSQCFRVFWQPSTADVPFTFATPKMPPQRSPISRRVASALDLPPMASSVEREVPINIDPTWSSQEQLRNQDFAQMSVSEVAQARAAIERIRLALPERYTRRWQPHGRHERIDTKHTYRKAIQTTGEPISLVYKSPRRRPLPIVAICDISGSMEIYARMMVIFLHSLTQHYRRVQSFLFGTRVSNITRYLRQRDPDRALDQLGKAVSDWSGGTRIASSLRTFNRQWGRRVLGQGALVLLITDGLDRDQIDTLAAETAFLQRSCRRLIWLNPLLRYAKFAPKAGGIRAMLPHVDVLCPMHNVTSLVELGTTLASSLAAGRPHRHPIQNQVGQDQQDQR